MTHPDPGVGRRLVALGASRLLGMAAWSALSPVVVAYAFLVFGAVAFGFVGAGVNEEGSLAQGLLVGLLALGDGAWVDVVFPRDLSFEQNALRLFGAVALGLFVLDWIVDRIRGTPDPPPDPPWTRFKRAWGRLAGFTAFLALVLLAGVLAEGPAGGLTLAWGLRAAFTAAAMGAAVLLFSTPPFAVGFVLNAIRRPVADAILQGGLSSSVTGR